MRVVDRSFDQTLELEESAAGPLAGGIVNQGYQCGMLWGGAFAAGAQAYRVHGPGEQAEAKAIAASQKIVESFYARTHEINCMEITDITKAMGKNQVLPILKFIIKGGPVGCFRMAAGYAPQAYSAINAAFCEENIPVPDPPVSCATILAQKMGASEMHTVMAAGLAGGIGLSGGACGALGAAIWIIGINGRKQGADKKVINARITATIDRFIKSADFKFECSEIVGRKFEDISDHSGHLRNGGCCKIIDTLASEGSVSLC